MQLTNGEGWQVTPAWSPDGTTITYSTSERGNFDLCSLPSDGTSEGSFEVLLDLDRGVGSPVYTPGGEGMVFTTGGDIGYLDLTTGEITEDFLATESREGDPALSEDGRWLAYTSNRTDAHSGTSSRTFGQCPQTAGNTLCGPRTDGSCSTGAETAQSWWRRTRPTPSSR
jgi:Tol biopolymer transport system component